MSDKVTSKPKYKTIKSGEIDYSDDSKVLQPKIDGSHTIFELNSDKPNEIYSYRTSKRTGQPINHSDQVPMIKNLTIPEAFNKTVLRGELYAQTDHTPLPAEQIGGMLNAKPEKSIEKQKEHGWLKPYIYDIVKFRGSVRANDPYKTKLGLINEISNAIPEFKSPETAFTPDQKRQLVESIKAKKHPDTKEGVVEWDLNAPGGKPGKLKFRDSHDVYVREIYPETDKHGKEKSQAGGFTYSWTPKGKIVGNVGTGFSRDKKIDMLSRPEAYIGSVARVKSSQRYSSGALRAPAFYSMDIEKNLEKGATMQYYQTKHKTCAGDLNKIAATPLREIDRAVKELFSFAADTGYDKAKDIREDAIAKKYGRKPFIKTSSSSSIIQQRIDGLNSEIAAQQAELNAQQAWEQAQSRHPTNFSMLNANTGLGALAGGFGVERAMKLFRAGRGKRAIGAAAGALVGALGGRMMMQHGMMNTQPNYASDINNAADLSAQTFVE